MLKVGTTEGRFRMVMPDLIAETQASFVKSLPDQMDRDVQEHENGTVIRGYMADAVELRRMLFSGDLDLAFSGLTPQMPQDIANRLILDEKLFFVISDRLLRRYRPEYLMQMREKSNTADLRDFTAVPVCRSLPHLHCMKILDAVLGKNNITLNCIHESGHYDLHLELAARDYAACFCLGMYLPYLNRINERTENKLHVFRIKGLQDTNPVYLLWKKKDSMENGSDAIRTIFTGLLEEKCREIAVLQDIVQSL